MSDGPSAASAASAGVAAIPFRAEGDGLGFPYAGAVLLVCLLALACWVVWHRPRRGKRSLSLARGIGWLGGQATVEDGGGVQVVATASLSAGASVHVVHWQGGKLLLGLTPHTALVVLDRQSNRPTGEDLS